jgi:hypothetical protein
MKNKNMSLSLFGRGALNTIAKGLLTAGVTLGLLALGTHAASAQEAEPNDFVPAPPGTNAVLGYYVYGHNSGYSPAKGNTISDASLDVNLGIARYVHWFAVGPYTAGVQVVAPFGSEGPGHIGSGPGSSLGNTFGLANTTFSAFIWPYNNPANKQYLILAGYVNPPIGSYDKTKALNVGGPGWSGEAQIGWDQGIGEHFSYDAAADIIAYGDTTSPGGVKGSTDPAFRLQAWANWNWTPKFQTAIGWESILGGTGYADTAYTGKFATGAKGEFERLRLNASYFVLPNAQVMLELNHDFVAVGGFKQVFGATARFLYLF